MDYILMVLTMILNDNKLTDDEVLSIKSFSGLIDNNIQPSEPACKVIERIIKKYTGKDMLIR